MTKFAYNIAKNTSISHIHFELNCGYYLQASYKKDINLQSQLKIRNKRVIKLKKLMTVYMRSF